MKKLLSLLLSLTLMLGVFSSAVAVNAVKDIPSDWTKDGDWYYRMADSGDYIAAAYVGDETVVNVPSTYKGRDVCYIGFDFLRYCSIKDKVKELYLPSTISGVFDYEIIDGEYDYTYYYKAFDLETYKELKKVLVSAANQSYIRRNDAIYSKDLKTLYYVPYADTGSTFEVLDGTETVMEIENANYKNITIPSSVKKIAADRIICPKLNKLYILSKTDNVYCADYYEFEEHQIPATATVYCYKDSGAYKYFNKYDAMKIKTEPKQPKKASIKSVKYDKYDGKYSVKVTVNKVDADGYKLYKYNSKTKKYEFVDYIYGSYVDTNVKVGETYKYKIASYNKQNKLWNTQSKSKSVSVNATKPPKPKKPTIKLTQLDGSNIEVMATVSGVSASGYKFYRYDSATKKYKKVATSSYKKLYDAKGLKSGTTYKYKLRAYNKAADGTTVYGSYSEVVKIKVK